jgi:hypothetical protein
MQKSFIVRVTSTVIAVLLFPQIMTGVESESSGLESFHTRPQNGNSATILKIMVGNDWLLTQADLDHSQIDRFASRVIDNPDAISKFIFFRLKSSTQSLIADYNSENLIAHRKGGRIRYPEGLLGSLRQEINLLLKKDFLYESNRFQTLSLGSDAKAILLEPRSD